MSRYADAAYEWLKKNSPDKPVSTDALWHGMRETYPDLTAVLSTRKTPRTTLMRDIRVDKQKRFIISLRTVRLNVR